MDNEAHTFPFEIAKRDETVLYEERRKRNRRIDLWYWPLEIRMDKGESPLICGWINVEISAQKRTKTTTKDFFLLWLFSQVFWVELSRRLLINTSHTSFTRSKGSFPRRRKPRWSKINDSFWCGQITIKAGHIEASRLGWENSIEMSTKKSSRF